MERSPTFADAVAAPRHSWPEASELLGRVALVRRRTVELCAPLTVEDQCIQPIASASPSKWHLAHTTWFFENFVLGRAGDEVFDPAFGFLFNSYYEAIGPRVPRARRGMLSRPGLDRIHAYRAHIDRRVAALSARELDAETRARIELGVQHEQQHQELILTDLKAVLGTQPTRPAYRGDLKRDRPGRDAGAIRWHTFGESIAEIGAPATGFAFDHERPRHRVLVEPFRIASRPISNAEVLGFIADGGYRDPRHWLSAGWDAVRAAGWTAPAYWEIRAEGAAHYDLTGMRAVDPTAPACHLSYYEADAIARWSGGRLPTEVEWEVAVARAPARGNFLDDDRLHPCSSTSAELDQMFGDVWEWTSSSYAPYPGFRPMAGALGEYNGKFMSGQHVLRGGSCLTPCDHVRASYRNFFSPGTRWQMTGARIATDA
ncbi:MAG: ergothioneine biosynthesis protein EgtB [Deltaproteobacteria bacterium]|nr:ergothioneine biosynthesis protein EgtB [Deltaproteobacteria bacterium]